MAGHEAIRLQLTRTEPFAALLMAGPDGLGKNLIAQWYAAWLNCENPPTSPPWNCDCLSCRKVLKGNHPDVQVLRREAGKLTLGVQEVRDFISSLSMRNYQARYRVSIIDEAEKLTDEAQSALLKTLEEPPPGQLLILVCSQEFSLLSTVRSRCRLYRFNPLPARLTESLLEARSIPPERAALFARLAEGRLGYALRLAQNERLWQVQEEALDLFSSLSQGGLWQALEVSRSLEALKVDDSTEDKGFAGARGGAEFHLNLARLYLRDLMILTCGDGNSRILLEHRREALEQSARGSDLGKWQKVLQRLEESRQHLESNVNPRFVLQSLCLTMAGNP